MASLEHLELVGKGAKAIHEWRLSNPNKTLDLRSIFLSAEILPRPYPLIDFDTARPYFVSDNLSGANLSGADLTLSRIVGVNLTGANLSEAKFSYANLYDCNLSGANLSSARLDLAHLVGTDLSEANLFKFESFRTVFADCDLSGASIPDPWVPGAPTNSIGIDTLVHTLRGTGGGSFTESQIVFFQLAGVPRTILDYLPGLVQDQPLQFYSTFISHGSEDVEFATRLYQDLASRGINCWKYDENALIGRGVWDNIDQAIHSYDKLVVVCSRDSLKRLPVLREIERALQKEDRLQGQGVADTDVLFPLRRDDYIFDEWEHHRKADIVAKHIGDFRDLSKYEEKLRELIRALERSSWPLTPAN